jgi:hypothetical protein
MSLLGKIFVVVVTILSLVFLGVQSTLYYHSTDWREAFERFRERHIQVVQAKDAEINKLQGSVKDAEDTVKRDEALVAQYKDQVKSAEDKATSSHEAELKSRSDLEQAAANLKSAVDNLTSKEKELTDTRSSLDTAHNDLATARGDKETAEAQVARLIGQKAALEKDLGEVRKAYSDTKQQLLDMQLTMEELERQGIPVATLVANHKPVPPINAKVAGVKSDVQPPLVLLTVGKDDHVEKGFQFAVYRGTSFVGKVVVEKVNADSAGCRVLFMAPGQAIKQGDDAATRLD